MSIKEKTLSGLKWSFIDNFFNYFIHFAFGIILARLIVPSEYGLIGMLTFFIAISQALVDSGFTQALIRKKDCTNEDYSTVFYFNLLASILIYFILFISAKYISLFYNEPRLSSLLKALSVFLIINAFAIVQKAQLTKNINFKLQTKISNFSSIISGIL